MKTKILLLFVLLCGVSVLVPAQESPQKSASATAQIRDLKKVLELKMPKTADDEYCGTRGASVCWNPVTKKYYAAFAGNTSFPLGVFDVKGKLLSDADQTTLQDTRGLWYNPTTKKISGNGYNDNGWFSYTLDSKGIPTDYVTDFSGMNQPDENSCGVYDPSSKSVLFLNKGKITYYDGKTAESGKSVPIHWGRKKSQGVGEDENEDNQNSDYNYTSVIYTGIKNAEFGLLNTLSDNIELYDSKTGFMQTQLHLPDGTPLEPSFNFAYANGIYWLFDIANRTWLGFK